MIKVKNNTATRESIPVFLLGLKPESLADLTWTDPALGVADCKWLPEVDQSPVLSEYERYGAETLTVASDHVIVTRAVVQWSAEEIQADLLQKSAKIQSEVLSAVQLRLDTFARTRNYDGILSACTYATSAVPKFKAEGQYCVNSRDSTWSVLYGILAAVQAGTRPMPKSYAEIEPELPNLTWP